MEPVPLQDGIHARGIGLVEAIPTCGIALGERERLRVRVTGHREKEILETGVKGISVFPESENSDYFRNFLLGAAPSQGERGRRREQNLGRRDDRAGNSLQLMNHEQSPERLSLFLLRGTPTGSGESLPGQGLQDRAGVQ